MIKKLRSGLESIRCDVISETNLRKEQVAKYKLGRLEDQLDLFWWQRAHAHWLENGDKTRATSMRMRRKERRKII
jgi:hypothetical protein